MEHVCLICALKFTLCFGGINRLENFVSWSFSFLTGSHEMPKPWVY